MTPEQITTHLHNEIMALTKKQEALYFKGLEAPTIEEALPILAEALELDKEYKRLNDLYSFISRSKDRFGTRKPIGLT